MHKKFIFPLIVILLASCSAENKDKLIEELNEDYETISNEIDAEIELLTEDIESVGDKARAEIDASIDELKDQKRELQKEIFESIVACTPLAQVAAASQ